MIILDIEFAKRLGQHISSMRQERGYTQEVLTAKMQLDGCDLTRSALAKIECGQRNIYPDELKAFKHVFDIGYEELLFDQENRV